MTACKNFSITNPTITISPASASVSIGSMRQLAAICKDQNTNPITCPTLTWISSNPLKATVSPSGLVTGVAAGTTSITATYGSATSNPSVITVPLPPPVLATITISPASTSIQIGVTRQLNVTCADQYGSAFTCPILTWTSSNPSKATVSSSGLVTGLAAGSTNITAGASGVTSNISAITVTLPPPVLTTITISPASTSVQTGATHQLNAACADQYGSAFTCPTLTWTSSNPSKATVSSSGLVTGVAAGSTNITAGASGVTSNVSTVTISAIPPVLTTITISPASTSIQTGATHQLNAACADQYGSAFTCPTLIWSSSNPSKATVNQSGLVTAIDVGSSDVSCTGGGLFSNVSTVIISAIPPVLTTITISPDSASIQIGATQQLNAICTDQYGSTLICPTLTWSSVSQSNATVDQSGLVTAIDIGSSSITAMASGVTSNVSVIMVTIPTPAEAGMGGMGMIILVGIGITALMSMKKPATT